MKLLSKFIYILPLLLLLSQVYYQYYLNSIPKISPISDKNSYVNQLLPLLSAANITPLQLTIRNYFNEIEFYIKDKPNHNYKVIFSTNKNALFQVNALQKVIKIANIKGREINFIDLSPRRPYATL